MRGCARDGPTALTQVDTAGTAAAQVMTWHTATQADTQHSSRTGDDLAHSHTSRHSAQQLHR